MLRLLGMLMGIKSRTSTNAHSPYRSRMLIFPFVKNRRPIAIPMSALDVMIHSVMGFCLLQNSIKLVDLLLR